MAKTKGPNVVIVIRDMRAFSPRNRFDMVKARFKKDAQDRYRWVKSRSDPNYMAR